MKPSTNFSFHLVLLTLGLTLPIFAPQAQGNLAAFGPSLTHTARANDRVAVSTATAKPSAPVESEALLALGGVISGAALAVTSEPVATWWLAALVVLGAGLKSGRPNRPVLTPVPIRRNRPR